MAIFVVYCIENITSISEFKTKWRPLQGSQRSHSASSGRILFLSLSHQKSIFMLIKKQVPRVQRNLSFDFCCVSQPPLSWGTLSHVPISLWQSPSSSPLLSPSCSWWNTQPAADLWDPYLKPPSLKLFQCLQDLFTQQNALHPPVLFKNSSLSIADHTKWLTGTSLTSVE